MILNSASPLSYGVILLLLSVAPIFILGLTSFIKFSIVFSVLRSALGAGQLPSAAITSLVSLVLTAYVMLPIFKDVAREIEAKKIKKNDLNSLIIAVQESSKPIQDFLEKHAGQREKEFFKQVNSEYSFVTVASAFVVSELKESFSVGFAIFLPFLAVDLIIANILVGMGMTMVSPVTITVPAKIALFVLSDGWYLLCKSLVLSYV